MVEEYRKGAPVNELLNKYGYKTKKSVIDKVKKYYPNNYKEIIEEARDNRRGYTYSIKEIKNPFDAYFIGLLLTDGYLLSDRDGVGLDMTDEDVISFITKTIGTTYKTYENPGKKPKHRVLITRPGITAELERFGIIHNKSLKIPAPNLKEEEKKFLPFIIRGIIDGDGTVSKTSYGGAQFHIVTMSLEFANWIKNILENNFFMDNIRISKNEKGLYCIESANQYNILKLIALVYNKPFGMLRKYNLLRKTFRDYNKDVLLDEDDGIVQTTTH